MIFCDAKEEKRSFDSLHFDVRGIINTAGFSGVSFSDSWLCQFILRVLRIPVCHSLLLYIAWH